MVWGHAVLAPRQRLCNAAHHFVTLIIVYGDRTRDDRDDRLYRLW